MNQYVFCWSSTAFLRQRAVEGEPTEEIQAVAETF